MEYKSTDKTIIRYHMELAKAMGITLQADLYGLAHERQPQYDGVFLEMLKIADEIGTQVSIMYEPQMHFLRKHDGSLWCAPKCNCNSRDEKIAAITADLKHYLEMIKGRGHLLFRIDNKPVITVFGTHEHDLTSAEWIRIKNALDSAKLPCVLIGDYPGAMTDNNSTAFNGAVAWSLAHPMFLDGLKNRAFTPFSWCVRLNEQDTQRWANSAAKRFGVAIVYLGFDSSGAVQIRNEPLRKISIDRKDFYRQSWEAALKSGFNIIQIASFNDFPEGTNIESDKKIGYELSEMTVDFVNKFKGADLNRNDVQRITESFLGFNKHCNNCEICKSGNPPRLGRILGYEEPTTMDALEILKNIVGLDGAIKNCKNARTAALIVTTRPIPNIPTTLDALEILKKLVAIPNEIDNP